MKKLMIFCDRCGKEIKEYPMKLSADYVSRLDGQEVEHKLPTAIRKLLEDDCERDYCESCMQEILEFAHCNMDPEAFMNDKLEDPELPNESHDADAAHQEEKEDDHPKRFLKRGQRDMIEQFFARGMDEEKIASLLGVAQIRVHEVIERVRREG